jgi:hypothetical protein
MLAYLFWHRPAEGQERAGYEQALMTFHDRLESVTIPGLVASGSARVGELPWTPGDGYEDWYLVEDFAALGVLNAAAVDDAHADAHDRVAHAAGFGAGALYALQAGDPEMTGSYCAWVTKPAGVDYREFLDGLAPHTFAGGSGLWRRQMVLGPAPEFRVTGGHPFSLPAGLAPVTCRLTAVGTA